eukprot:3547104-Rhodomonas_salina.1
MNTHRHLSLELPVELLLLVQLRQPLRVPRVVRRDVVHVRRRRLPTLSRPDQYPGLVVLAPRPNQYWQRRVVPGRRPRPHPLAGDSVRRALGDRVGRA